MAAAFVSLDFYSVLDLGRDATTQEINAAYKKLALKYHPDKGGDQHLEKFRSVCHFTFHFMLSYRYL